MPDFRVFGWNLKILLSYLKPTPQIFLIVKFLGQECLNLEPNMPDLRIFVVEFEIAIVIFGILHPKICLNSKFPKKMKTLNLGLKMSYLCIFGLES